MSAISAIGGAYAENVPVFHLVGMPSLGTMESHGKVHHSLGNGEFDFYFKMTEPVVCARAIMTPENCASETERLIAAARFHRQPVYMGFPADCADMPVLDKADPIPDPASEPASLKAAVKAIVAMLGKAKTAIIVPGIITTGLGLKDQVIRLIDSSGLPFATVLPDKTAVDETHPNFIGVFGQPPTRSRVAVIAALFALTLPALCQTNPAPQVPPYSQDFGTVSFNTLPAGLAAWGGLSGGSVSSVAAASASIPTADATVTSASAAQSTGGLYGLGSGGNGRFYIQTSSNTANGANQLALALDTTGQTGITLSYDVEIVSANPRTIGVVCQWRVGVSGAWTAITPETDINPCSQAGGSPGPLASVHATLPSGADNKPLVQVRWRCGVAPNPAIARAWRSTTWPSPRLQSTGPYRFRSFRVL